MNEETKENLSPYYIFLDGGSKWFLLGQAETYEETLDKAVSFEDKLDAILHMEKHGLQKIATIRKVK